MMKRLLILLGCILFLGTPALAKDTSPKVTRADFAQLLADSGVLVHLPDIKKYRQREADLTEASSEFPDVTESHPHYDAIVLAGRKGVMEGYNLTQGGAFLPDYVLSRSAFCMFLSFVITPFEKHFGKPFPRIAPPPSFSDFSRNNLKYKLVSWMVELGIAIGYSDGTFEPDTRITPADATSWIASLKQLVQAAVAEQNK